MKTYKQKTDFLHIGNKLLLWYKVNARELPWRESKLPYNIWISEIILQQTQVKQGLQHYLNFVARFPDVKTLSNADENEVLLYWKGLGYYSRAINIHKASQQIINEYKGFFPTNYHDILKLRGVGKYTAAAIASICFDERKPAIDGNFYRVLSRLFADDFDVSNSKAFKYFEDLAFLVMPNKDPGNFNQAIMDLGASICKPKNPICSECPVQENCIAFEEKKVLNYPVKSKKVKVQDLKLNYYFICYDNYFLVKQRGDDFIWKKLFEFPTIISDGLNYVSEKNSTILHKLSHKKLEIEIEKIIFRSEIDFEEFANQNQFQIMDIDTANKVSFPKPLEQYYLKEL